MSVVGFVVTVHFTIFPEFLRSKRYPSAQPCPADFSSFFFLVAGKKFKPYHQGMEWIETGIPIEVNCAAAHFDSSFCLLAVLCGIALPFAIGIRQKGSIFLRIS